MDAQSTQKGLSSNTETSNISNSAVSSASFKKLQPEEFYRHHIEKVSATAAVLLNATRDH